MITASNTLSLKSLGKLLRLFVYSSEFERCGWSFPFDLTSA